MFKKLFAKWFPASKPKATARLDKLETTLQFVYKEIQMALAKEPRIGTLHDDELIMGVAQILMEDRLVREHMKEQERPKTDMVAGAELSTKSYSSVTTKKRVTYH